MAEVSEADLKMAALLAYPPRSDPLFGQKGAKVRRIAVAIAAARDEGRREEREQQRWQPIETAPNDGKPILVVQRDLFSGWHYWVEHRGASERWVNPDGTDDKPDGWMPLEPPHA